MTTAFNRTWKITAYWPPEGKALGENPDFSERLDNGLEITALDIQATIKRTSGKEPNTGELVILNAAAATRARLVKKPLTVRIEAGYDGVNRFLFLGNLRYGTNTHEGTDHVAKLVLADGGRAYSNAHVSKEYKSGTPYAVIIRDVAESIGVQMPKNILAAPEFQTRVPAGYNLDGRASEELTRLLAPFGYSWSIQNGKLQALPDDAVREERAWLINREAGLVGTPQYSPPDDKGGPATLQFKTLLFPELIPKGRVNIDSRNVKGEHKIKEVEHRLDTAGTDWYTDVKAEQMS